MTPEATDATAQRQFHGKEPTTRQSIHVCTKCGRSLALWPGVEISVCERCLLGLAAGPIDLESCHDEEFPIGLQAMQTLGDYSLIEEIGRGGMGVIYRAAHRQTGEVVAVKTVLPHQVGDPETLLRFQREAAAAQSLDHPYSMPIYKVGSSNEGIPFFSMKLAQGGSLAQLEAKYRGRWRQIAELLVKISKAVHQAHSRGILHRDLKPGNILFTEDQQPLVTDFGLVKQLTGSDDLTQSCAVLGTPNYVAPEQAAGKTRELTPATDIYSLGAILYELLTGRPPFIGDNSLEVLQKVVSQFPSSPRSHIPSIPRGLEMICMRCLEREPENRYDSARDLADDLNGWMQGRKIISSPVYTRLWRGVKRHPMVRAWCYGIAGLAALLVVSWIAAGRSVQATNGMTTIAVAIDDLGQDSSLKFIARQASDELTRELSKTQIFRLQGGGVQQSYSSAGVLDPLAYARTCHAQVVLSGCVRRSGGKVRLVTRLIRCDTEEVIWRHDESIALNQVASATPLVAQAMITELATNWRANPRSSTAAFGYSALPEAQMFYIRAKELAARTNRNDLRIAVGYFRQAADLDPHFAAARAMLAFALWVQADRYGEIDKLPLALSAARQALAVDPHSAQAHRVIASCYFKKAHNDEALKEFWNAVELNPQSAGCFQSLGICLREMGHPRQAILWLTRATQLDQVHGVLSANLGESLALCGCDQPAETAIMHSIDLDGNQPDARIVLTALRTWQKKFGEARELCSQVRRRFPESRFGLNLAAWIALCDGSAPEAELDFQTLRAEDSYRQNWDFYGAINPSSALAFLAKQMGSTAQARLLAEEAIKMDRKLLDDYPNNARILHDLAATYAVIGETERALFLFDEAISAGWGERRSTEIDPRFTGISALPRFKTILVRILPDSTL